MSDTLKTVEILRNLIQKIEDKPPRPTILCSLCIQIKQHSGGYIYKDTYFNNCEIHAECPYCNTLVHLPSFDSMELMYAIRNKIDGAIFGEVYQCSNCGNGFMVTNRYARERHLYNENK